MKGQPHHRQVRFLSACAGFAAFVAIIALVLIRVDCARLAPPALSARIGFLSGLILLAGLAGASSLAAAGQILIRHHATETDALRRLYKHTVKKANRILGKMGGVASPPVTVAAAGRPETSRGVVMPFSRAARTAAHALRNSTCTAEIDLSIRQLETVASEIGAVLKELRHSSAPDREQLYKLASALDSASRKPPASRPQETRQTDLAVI